MTEDAAELLLRHVEDGLSIELQKFVAGLEFRHMIAGGMAVVWATQLALVAAVNPVANYIAHPLGQLAAVLDGQA